MEKVQIAELTLDRKSEEFLDRQAAGEDTTSAPPRRRPRPTPMRTTSASTSP